MAEDITSPSPLKGEYELNDDAAAPPLVLHRHRGGLDLATASRMARGLATAGRRDSAHGIFQTLEGQAVAALEALDSKDTFPPSASDLDALSYLVDAFGQASLSVGHHPLAILHYLYCA